MALKLPEARKKKRTKMQLKNPLPFPINLEAEDEQPTTQTVFQGFFFYGSVIIEDSKSAETLWENVRKINLFKNLLTFIIFFMIQL